MAFAQGQVMLHKVLDDWEINGGLWLSDDFRTGACDDLQMKLCQVMKQLLDSDDLKIGEAGYDT